MKKLFENLAKNVSEECYKDIVNKTIQIITTTLNEYEAGEYFEFIDPRQEDETGWGTYVVPKYKGGPDKPKKCPKPPTYGQFKKVYKGPRKIDF